MTPAAMNEGKRNGVKVGRFVWLWEIECPHCGMAIARPRLIKIFNRIRADHGGPISPTSWNRCVHKNRDVYAAKNEYLKAVGLPEIPVNETSPHLIGDSPDIIDFGGYAFDIPIVFSIDRESWFREIGVVGVGFGSNFTHIDIKPRPGISFRSWTYVDGRATVLTAIAA